MIEASAFSSNGMEFYALEDEELRICVCPRMGGELSSVQYMKLLPERELLFRGNDYSPTDLPFKGRAPFMWPTVTRNYIAEIEPTVSAANLPPRCSYRYRDRVYYVGGRSGFARDFPWRLLHHSAEGGIRVGLESSPATLQMYPFEFALTAEYRIENGGIRVQLRVHNRSR